jgi:NADH-quinone oxidoreductase subunit M
MGFYDSHWVLTFLIFAPLVGAVIAAFAGERAKHVALGVGYRRVSRRRAALLDVPADGRADAEHEVAIPWLPGVGDLLPLGLDGISLFMVLLTALLLPLSVLGSWSYIKTRQPAFYAMLLALTTGCGGRFRLPGHVPVLRVLGDDADPDVLPDRGVGRKGADLRGGEVLPLHRRRIAADAGRDPVPLLPLPGADGVASFSYFDFLQLPLTWVSSGGCSAPSRSPSREGAGLPVPHLAPGGARAGAHRGLRGAGRRAPEDGDVRAAPLRAPALPGAATATFTVTLFLVLGLIGIIYTAMVAAVQTNAKRLVAYTSVAHLGFAVLGIFALNLQGIQGALILMIAHGVSTPMLFFLLGMMYERRHSYEIEDLRRAGFVGADLRDDAGDRGAGLHRAAGHERLRRRVPGAGGDLPSPRRGSR